MIKWIALGLAANKAAVMSRLFFAKPKTDRFFRAHAYRTDNKYMELLLHRPDSSSDLRRHYVTAINDAIELYIVSAYLTNWDPTLPSPAKVKRFRIVVGTDFGVTRKSACRNLLKWMPASSLNDFRAAEGILGFHPKAAFWKTANGTCHAIVGSSNLTRAAFDKNVEANVLGSITPAQFAQVKEWIDWITESPQSVPISEEWIDQYQEAPISRTGGGGKNESFIGKNAGERRSVVVHFQLPVVEPKRAAALVGRRRAQMKVFGTTRAAIETLFRKTASGNVSSEDFYEEINQLWSWSAGNRLQGAGWERHGSSADFTELAEAFVDVLDSEGSERDDVVRGVLNRLEKTANPARKAWFSEMLALHWPDRYPVLNGPVRSFLVANAFRPPRRATEGVRYIDLAEKLRTALARRPKGYPAKTIVELDYLIWATAPGNEDYWPAD